MTDLSAHVIGCAERAIVISSPSTSVDRGPPEHVGAGRVDRAGPFVAAVTVGIDDRSPAGSSTDTTDLPRARRCRDPQADVDGARGGRTLPPGVRPGLFRLAAVLVRGRKRQIETPCRDRVQGHGRTRWIRASPGGPGRPLPRRSAHDLTRPQRRAVAEIGTDLAQASPMHQLLQGVGSGRRSVAMATLRPPRCRADTRALMAPTEGPGRAARRQCLPPARRRRHPRRRGSLLGERPLGSPCSPTTPQRSVDGCWRDWPTARSTSSALTH